MTPLQVIMLAHKTRLSQKAFHSSLKGEAPLGDRYQIMAELEAQLDAAIEPYVNYNRAFELQEKGYVGDATPPGST
jgi:hypothetical protein